MRNLNADKSAMTFDAAMFLGENGGALAIAYAFGCASTWVFTNKVMVKPLVTRVKLLERKFLDIHND